MKMSLKQGAIAVTADRLVVAAHAEGHPAATHVIERRAVTHVVTVLGWNQRELLLGLALVVLGILGTIYAGDAGQSDYTVVGIVGIVIGAFVIYFAKKGAFRIVDTSGADASIPLKRSELDRAQEFILGFAVTMGSRR